MATTASAFAIMSTPATGPMPRNCRRRCRVSGLYWTAIRLLVTRSRWCATRAPRHWPIRWSWKRREWAGFRLCPGTRRLPNYGTGAWNSCPPAAVLNPASGRRRRSYSCMAKSICACSSTRLALPSEQLNSTTAALTRVTQKLRRLATELSRPQARFTEQGIRNKIHRWLLDPFVREVLHYGLEQRENRWHLTFEVDNKALQQL